MYLSVSSAEPANKKESALVQTIALEPVSNPAAVWVLELIQVPGLDSVSMLTFTHR